MDLAFWRRERSEGFRVSMLDGVPSDADALAIGLGEKGAERWRGKRELELGLGFGRSRPWTKVEVEKQEAHWELESIATGNSGLTIFPPFFVVNG